jgi:hypothetical protein
MSAMMVRSLIHDVLRGSQRLLLTSKLQVILAHELSSFNVLMTKRSVLVAGRHPVQPAGKVGAPNSPCHSAAPKRFFILSRRLQMRLTAQVPML